MFIFEKETMKGSGTEGTHLTTPCIQNHWTKQSPIYKANGGKEKNVLEGKLANKPQEQQINTLLL